MIFSICFNTLLKPLIFPVHSVCCVEGQHLIPALFHPSRDAVLSSLCPVLEPFTATLTLPPELVQAGSPTVDSAAPLPVHSSFSGCFSGQLLSLLKPSCSGTAFYFFFIKMQDESVKLCHLCGDVKGCRNHCACFSPLFLSFSCLFSLL